MRYGSRSYTALLGGALSFTLALAPVEQARAQWAVIDVANLMQNTMNELHTLETTVNQMTQIANQVTSLGNQLQNLTNVPASVTAALLSQYVNTWNQLNSTWSSIGGLASNLTTVATKYQTLFPNWTPTSGPGTAALTPTQILSQTGAYLNEARQDLEGVAAVTAAVAKAQPALMSQLQETLMRLNFDKGTTAMDNDLGQLQAINAQQLQQITTLIMANDQAQAAILSQQVQMQSADAAMAITVSAPPTPAPAAPVAYYP